MGTAQSSLALGSVFLRYISHADLTLLQAGRLDRLCRGEPNFFTDRQVRNCFRSSELDLVGTLGVRWRDWELSVMRESDQPMDRDGLVQSYYAVMLRWYFDLKRFLPPPAQPM